MPLDDDNYARKVEELDRLLNDPNVPFDPSQIWHLMTQISSLHQSDPEPPSESLF